MAEAKEDSAVEKFFMRTAFALLLLVFCTLGTAAQDATYNTMEKRLDEAQVLADILEINHAHYKLSVTTLEQALSDKKDVKVVAVALTRTSTDLLNFRKGRGVAWSALTNLTGSMVEQVSELSDAEARKMFDKSYELMNRLSTFDNIPDPAETMEKAFRIVEGELQRQAPPPSPKKTLYRST